jgi:hypothetical protein
MSECCDLPKASGEFISGEIILFGIHLSEPAPKNPARKKERDVLKEDKDGKTKPNTSVKERYGTLNFGGTKELRIATYEVDANSEFLPSSSKFAFISAFGYAFEGHCYRFDKPKIFVVPSTEAPETAQGCGFDNMGYSMWRLRALDQALELTATYDTLQKLALEASMPGRRAPNTYEANMQLAHRGGRLTG